MDAFEFLETLPNATLESLYADPWVCQAVFQSLPSIAQQFVMRLLSCNTVVQEQVLREWLVTQVQDNSSTNLGKKKPLTIEDMYKHSISKLRKLRIFAQSSTDSYQLHTGFQKQLKYALCHLGGCPWEEGRRKLGKDMEVSFTSTELERYARSHWDAVLHYMVGSTSVPDPPQAVVDILLRTNLMQSSVDQRALHITDKGYEFMLKDIHIQMWIFILEYIKTLDRTGALKQEDILQFLFQISYCQVNAYYPVQDLTKTQQLLLTDFNNFGLLYRKRSNSDRFYTTSLAVNLIFGGTTASNYSEAQVARPHMSSMSDLSTIVETNFKVYAYTTSTLHIAMLSVFVDIVARLPNLAIGFITRESLRSALVHGISAQQIYDFLLKHAHPRMKKNNPIVPENIADQIYLWETIERNRIKFIDGILFDGFNSKEEFEQVRVYAQKQRFLTWTDPIHLKLAISSNGIESIRQFIQKSLVSQ